MPVRNCQNCNSGIPDWDVSNNICRNCGFSYDDIIDSPSSIQAIQIAKHRRGAVRRRNRNWQFFPHIDEKDIIETTISKGSCVSPFEVVVSFSSPIGFKETNPSEITKWAIVVLYDDPIKCHAYPLNPSVYNSEIWECTHCGTQYTHESPPICRKCGKNLWM